MDFALDDTQQTVASVAAGTLARETDESAWKALGQAGLLSLAVPKRLGGEGLGVLETAVVLAEVGRAAAAVPALSSLALGVLPIVRCGTEAQHEELLAEVASGDRVLTAALRERSRPNGLATVARGDGGGYRVSGTKVGVTHAGAAHRVLVPAQLAGGGAAVFLVDPHAPGTSLTRTPTSSGAPEFTVRLDEAPADLLGNDVTGHAVVELHRLAVAGACAVGDGIVAGALDLTAEHVRSREQFGKPLATFQAVAQQIADVYVAARTLHLATWSACWRLGTGLDPDEDLEIAAYWLAEEALAALHVCHHLHGGLGVDVTYPMHRYYAAAKDLVRLLGGADHRLDVLGGLACTSS